MKSHVAAFLIALTSFTAVGAIAQSDSTAPPPGASAATGLPATPSPVATATPGHTATGTPEASTYIQWLEQRSMLYQADELARQYSGNSVQWRHAYGKPQPRAAVARASVWFTAYPASTIPAVPGASVLTTLADKRLWSAFQTIGIQGIHTGPMKRSGGIHDLSYTPSVDGNFDRISFEMDPAFGTEAQYKDMVAIARAHGAIVIGDIIPGHTGKGADFRLAERAYGEYPGIYHMVQIDPKDWNLLASVKQGHDSVNLDPDTVNALQGKGYIVGMLSSRIFYQPGVKDSDWSATDVVRGVDGVDRRWVYLHYFKEGQPTLNWLDPTFGAERLVIGDAVHELGVLGDGMLRLDANALLGIERQAGGGVWSEGHPMSQTANQLIADMVRKLGGFTFEELGLQFDAMSDLAKGGPDLSYDFETRPAYDHALLTGDAGFLRLVFQLMHQYNVDPGRLVHALQNHDELTGGLAHFSAHADDKFPFRGGQITGRELQELIHREIHEKMLAPRAPYNLEFGGGVSSTTATVIAASLGIHELSKLSRVQVRRIRQLHLLLAFYNAMQPGVFALSGWDLVGALTLPASRVHDRLSDGDTRWINRGAYDLLGTNPKAIQSEAGLPRAVALYGSVPQQLEDPESFASQLARLLKARATLRLYAAELVAVPTVKSKGLLVLVHELPERSGLEVTAINFGEQELSEDVPIQAAAPGSKAADVLDSKAGSLDLGPTGTLHLQLKGYEAKAFRIGS
jgi:trehalose synthase